VVGAAAEWRQGCRACGLTAPAIGLAVVTGEVLFGTIGDETRLEYTVIGETVNRAAKLEKHCKAEGVTALATAEAVTLALAQGWRPAHAPLACPARAVEGIAEPLDLMVLAP
jgi:adenylate cyclase